MARGTPIRPSLAPLSAGTEPSSASVSAQSSAQSSPRAADATNTATPADAEAGSSSLPVLRPAISQMGQSTVSLGNSSGRLSLKAHPEDLLTPGQYVAEIAGRLKRILARYMSSYSISVLPWASIKKPPEDALLSSSDTSPGSQSHQRSLRLTKLALGGNSNWSSASNAQWGTEQLEAKVRTTLEQEGCALCLEAYEAESGASAEDCTMFTSLEHVWKRMGLVMFVCKRLGCAHVMHIKCVCHEDQGDSAHGLPVSVNSLLASHSSSRFQTVKLQAPEFYR